MTAPKTPPLPASLLRAEAEQRDLDARILQAEQRLIAREENLRRRVNHIGERLREAWRPQRLVLPLAGGAAALAGLLWLVRGRAAAPRAEARAAERPQMGGHAHWISLLGMAWPLLPAAWRARVPPSLVQLATAVGLPVLDMLLHRQPRRELPPLATAAPLDPALLAGPWHELARLPGRRGRAQPRWQHTFDDDGLLQMHEQPAGTHRPVQALARVVPGSGWARWQVSAWPAWLHLLPGAWHEMAVLHLDDAGGELLLGSPARDRLQLLAREPALAPERVQALLALAQQQGYELEQLQFIDPA